jgi:hypothetical protein
MIVQFLFQVVEIDGKNEILLVLEYATSSQAERLPIAFKEKDFIRLREILSDENIEKARSEVLDHDRQKDLFQ